MGARIYTCKDVETEAEWETVRGLAGRMWESLRLLRNGEGLSAPQVGVNLRFFVLARPDVPGPLVFVNPRIVGGEGFVWVTEPCPSRLEAYRRPRMDAIALAYEDTLGEPQVRRFEFPMSVLIQHELDHIDGFDPASEVHA
jgi:peptide deformylase